jgi:ABC-type multidrug transport system fused ATPase/permease subunit
MRIMARLLGERKGLFGANLGLRLVKDLLPFLGPILIGMTVDLLSGASGRDRNLLGIELTQNDVRSIVIVAAFMAWLAVAKTAVGYIHTIIAAHMGRHVVQAARRDLAEAAMQMSLDERRRFNSGDLLDRCLADSKGLRGFTQNVIIRIISNTVRVVFPVVFMFTIDPLLAVVVLAVIPLQSSISALLQRRLQRQTHVARGQEALHTSAVKEAIDGWNNVASVGGQDWAAQGINDTAAASEDAKIVKKHTTALISAVISLFTAFGIAAVYAIGGWRIITSGVLDGTGNAAAGALTLGSLTAFIGVAKKTYAPFQAYTKIISSYRTGLVNLERIADVLDAPMIDPRQDGPDLQVGDGNITLDNVSFAYNEGSEPTLKELTGSIPGRSLTVITGSSGAGKTTLLRLLLGLDVPGTGTVSIDGQDINKAKYSTVQTAIVLVPQEPVLFTGTMSENLLLGLEETTTKQLLEACDRAGLLETVRELPNGLDTEVGSGKHMLSGGQLRRMAIARALLRRPGVMLLDEPTTGLDVQNSSLVLNTLRRISDHTTVVMVSHRSEPLKASDHHLILKNGGWSSSEDHQAAESRPLPTPPPVAIPHAVSVNQASAPASGTTRNDASRNDASTNGASTNGASTNGSLSNGASTNGSAVTPTTPDQLLRHYDIDQQVLALSAMGRPIVLSGIESDQATTRVMLISGHRALARPITGIAPAVCAQAIADDHAVVALASIEDVNPDGAFSSRRETVLGIDVETDHRNCTAAETLALHRAFDHWRTDLVIDVATRATILESPHHVEIAVRFRPDAEGQPSTAIAAFASEIRAQLDSSSLSYRVSMSGCIPGSATEVLDLPVVELTAQSSTDANVIKAMIEATVATYRAASTSSQLTTA